jgi:hypothetical protein
VEHVDERHVPAARQLEPRDPGQPVVAGAQALKFALEVMTLLSEVIKSITTMVKA